MKRVLLGVLCALVLAYPAGVAIYAATGGSSAVASPVHVVNVYLDGLNHFDYRQACSTIHAPTPFPTLSKCEAYFAFNTAMTGPQEYRIVKGSQKTWTQAYRGRDVRLAVVQYANLTTPYILTAHLRVIHGAWKLVAVTT